MSDNPMDKLSTLAEKLAQVAEAAGLHLETVAFLPGQGGSPHLAQAILSIDPEVAFATPEEKEQNQFDDEFANLAAQFDVSTRDDAAAEIKSQGKDLLDELRNLGTDDSFLDDNDD